LRPGARWANSGGFKKKARKIFGLSGHAWFFNLKNPKGAPVCNLYNTLKG